MKWTTAGQLALVLVVALGLRLAAGWWWQSRLGDDRFGFGDSQSYWTLGRAIARGQPYQTGPESRVFRTPGIPVAPGPDLRAVRRRAFGALGEGRKRGVRHLGGRRSLVAGTAALFKPGGNLGRLDGSPLPGRGGPGRPGAQRSPLPGLDAGTVVPLDGRLAGENGRQGRGAVGAHGIDGRRGHAGPAELAAVHALGLGRGGDLRRHWQSQWHPRGGSTRP